MTNLTNQTEHTELTTLEILDKLNESIEENNRVLDELKEVLARQV